MITTIIIISKIIITSRLCEKNHLLKLSEEIVELQAVLKHLQTSMHESVFENVSGSQNSKHDNTMSVTDNCIESSEKIVQHL